MLEKHRYSVSDRIDSLLEEWNIMQKELCESINISSAAISSLRKSKGMPAADTALKIAGFFNVSPDWLVFGEIKFPKAFESRPSQIYDRIYKLLLEETKLPNPDFSEAQETTFEALHAPILALITKHELINWRDNRNYPSSDSLKAIAKHFNKSYDYIANGIYSREVEDFTNANSLLISQDEYEEYCKYKQYKSLIWSYNAMYEPDKKYIANLIKRLFRLRRTIENRDYDYDYNREHPLEEPRQKDPNISDEEYDEIYKDSRKGL